MYLGNLYVFVVYSPCLFRLFFACFKERFSLWCSIGKAKKGKYRCGQRSQPVAGRCGMQPKRRKPSECARGRSHEIEQTETMETFELVEGRAKLFKRGEKRENEKREVRERGVTFCISSSKLIC
ncbi:hypothetical protein TNCV_2503361 [Trichonephila clavipes]|nr:hypothetical protein TNCV_2503361 [Trichonephila clavipes]